MDGLKTLYIANGEDDMSFTSIEIGLEHDKNIYVSITNDLSKSTGVISKATVVLNKKEVYEIIEVLSAHMNI